VVLHEGGAAGDENDGVVQSEDFGGVGGVEFANGVARGQSNVGGRLTRPHVSLV